MIDWLKDNVGWICPIVMAVCAVVTLICLLTKKKNGNKQTIKSYQPTPKQDEKTSTIYREQIQNQQNDRKDPVMNSIITENHIVKEKESLKTCVTMKKKYYVNNWQQDGSGYNHEVHKEGCRYMPSDVTPLGEFYSADEALQKAKEIYWDADGCAYCCPDINHG